MKLSPLFLLFLALAALLLINAFRSFSLLRKPLGPSVPNRSSPIASGVVSLLGAIGLAAAGYYMFQF